MNKKYIYLTVFILVALAQLYIPAKMIRDREKVLDSGEEYKFRVAPIDPNDPLRGKYIDLSYSDNIVEIQNEKDWNRGETIYVLLTKNSKGFAQNKSISKIKPIDDLSFLKAKVSFITSDGSNNLTIEYPFNRFYMEESKVVGAELAYNRSLLDTSQVTYALVSIRNGEAVLKDIMINGISIRSQR